MWSVPDGSLLYRSENCVGGGWSRDATQVERWSRTLKAEGNSIFTAEGAEDRRELQSKEEQLFLFALSEPQPQASGPLRSSASSAVKNAKL